MAKSEHVLKTMASDRERLISHIETAIDEEGCNCHAGFRKQAELLADSLISAAWIAGIDSE